MVAYISEKIQTDLSIALLALKMFAKEDSDLLSVNS